MWFEVARLGLGIPAAALGLILVATSVASEPNSEQVRRNTMVAKDTNDSATAKVRASARASASSSASSSADKKATSCSAKSMAAAEARVGDQRVSDYDEDSAHLEGGACSARAEAKAEAKVSADTENQD